MGNGYGYGVPVFPKQDERRNTAYASAFGDSFVQDNEKKSDEKESLLVDHNPNNRTAFVSASLAAAAPAAAVADNLDESMLMQYEEAKENLDDLLAAGTITQDDYEREVKDLDSEYSGADGDDKISEKKKSKISAKEVELEEEIYESKSKSVADDKESSESQDLRDIQAQLARAGGMMNKASAINFEAMGGSQSYNAGQAVTRYANTVEGVAEEMLTVVKRRRSFSPNKGAGEAELGDKRAKVAATGSSVRDSSGCR